MGTLRLVRDGVQVASIPVTASAGVVNVAPGADLNAAYATVPNGGTIRLASGNYGTWATSAGSKPVTVVAAVPMGARFTQIKVNANNMTFDGLNLDAGGTTTTGAVFETGGQSGITFRNGYIGNVHDEKGALLGGADNPQVPLNIWIDNTRFGRITFSAGTHSESIYSQAPGLKVTNCYFESQGGATGAIFITRGDWWGQGEYDGWTFTGNTFERQQADHGGIVFGDQLGLQLDSAEIHRNEFKHSTALPVSTNPKAVFTNSHASGNTLNGQPVSIGLPGIINS